MARYSYILLAAYPCLLFLISGSVVITEKCLVSLFCCALDITKEIVKLVWLSIYFFLPLPLPLPRNLINDCYKATEVFASRITLQQIFRKC